MRDSIFYSVIRSFVSGIFSLLGMGLGLLLVIVIIAGAAAGVGKAKDNEPEIVYTYDAEVMPNADYVRKEPTSETPLILRIDINGIIGTELLSRQTVEEQLIESRERFFKDGQVKALLLFIDSPGGTVTDADGIYRAIKAYKEHFKVPVYAHIDGLCASGGMYIAAAADKVYASEASLIGSIGVLSPSFMNFSQLMEKVGVQSLTLSAGKGKDDMNPLRPWKPGEQDALQSIIAYYYQEFVNIVVAGRPGVNKEKLINDYGAKIFPAKVAQEYGFIDDSGYSVSQTLKLLVQQAGITDDNYAVIRLQSNNWLSTLFNSHFGLLTGKITHKVSLSPELEPELMNQFLYLHRFDR